VRRLAGAGGRAYTGDAAPPFGGHKMSGYGRELGEYTLEVCTGVKTVYVNLAG
jgi:acyl-CoA reductase-like NAD-dependent aldehyde dehydrogenase